jgi:hypothetical protein
MRTLLVGIAIMIAGATAVRAQTRDTVIFGLPLYNRDEAVKSNAKRRHRSRRCLNRLAWQLQQKSKRTLATN